MTKRWRVEFDGMWVISGPTMDALRKAGYSVGVDRLGGLAYNYTLHRIEGQVGVDAKFPVIFETKDPDELNRYVNLILGPRED